MEIWNLKSMDELFDHKWINIKIEKWLIGIKSYYN